MPYLPIDEAIKQNPDFVKQNYPNVYSQYLQQINQPSATLQQTQASIPGVAAQSQISQVSAQQKGALQNLSHDLNNHMTLPSAINKYTALGMSADDVFKQYLAESPFKLPNQNPQQLQELGVTPTAMGQIGTPGSFMDKYNTRNAIVGLRSLADQFNQTSALSKLPFLKQATPSGKAYEAARQIYGEHLSSLIPGASGAQQSVTDLLNTLPDGGNATQLEPGAASGQFNAVEDQLLKTKGYSARDLGLPQGTNQPATGKGKDLLSGLLNTIIPTGGAIAGGLAGAAGGALIPGLDLTGAPEVAGAISGSSAGGAGGQALADLLTGRKPGADVAITGALSGLGEGAGAGLGAILGKAGGALANKVPGDVFNKIVSAAPDYTTNIAALKNTANKYGLMAGSTAQGLNQMPKVMGDISTQIQNGLAQVKTPVNLASVTKSILDDFSKKTNAFENSADFAQAQDFIKNRLYSATGNDSPLSKILNAQGNPMTKEGAQTTYSALYKLKSEVADDLKPVFKAQANPNLSTNFTPKQEANLALWDGLKKEIDKADPNIRVLNDDQHNMFNIAKGFVKDANTGKGGGTIGDIFDILAGNMIGGLPGALTVGIGGRILQSEGGRASLSKILQAGQTKAIVKGAGAGIGGALGGIFGSP